jgi:hypothetical protein
VSPLVIAILCSAACDHREPPTSPPLPIPAVPATTPASGCTLAPLPLRVSATHVVAVGDLHGDLSAARAALRVAKAIDDQDRWIGGDLVVVQTGDVLDRGDDESAILELLARLDREARATGGAVIQLLGNHELMNAAGDVRYVTPGGRRDFDGRREAELAPGGVWARRLAQHDVVAVVGGAVFSHAGVLGDWAAHVDETNLATRCWLDGQVREPPTALSAQDGPVWTRVLGMPGTEDCAGVSAALATLRATRMVVAHTVQDHGITSACDGKLWRIDVGLAKLYGGPIEVLELRDGIEPEVLHGTR